jgi:hypothetical protein
MSTRKPAGTAYASFCDQFNEKVELLPVVQIQSASGAITPNGRYF